MEIRIIKTFKDGTVLVSSDEGDAIMDLSEYERLRMRNFDLKREIINRLKTTYPHCSFSIHEFRSRDHVFMDDDIELTNLSIGSIEFWMRSERMNYDEAMNYVSTKLLPPIEMEVNKVEYQRCLDDQHYFYRNYARNKVKKD